jgi:hypothetical protein
MKTRSHFKLLISAILSMWLINGCAEQTTKTDSGSKASPEATAAIASAGSAIKAAKANNWIWRDTEKFLKQAQAAADKGDNDAAVKLANKVKFQAESAVTQYKYEKANPRGL